ncbi:MAG: hypothetical protein K5795_05790 [Lachnospiraceae bacterium]|nr:hypothetical protein [Lachnospiraceae bacterium]
MEYIVGIDFCRDFTQLCIYNPTNNSADAVHLSSDKQSTRIRSALTYSLEQKEWMVYSVLHDMKPGLKVVDNLYDLALNDESVMIGDEEYTPDAVLSRFISRLFFSLNRDARPEDIIGVTVTVADINRNLYKNIASALELAGIPKERYRICDHIESFMYYVVMQNKDIWINDVGLFDFGEEGLKFFVLHFGRKQQPLAVVAESTDFSDTVRYSMLKETDDIRLKYAFESVCGIMLHKQTVSAIYATGDGFEGSWSDEILKKISTGRRIFRGQNLYVKAAAYTAHLFFEGGSENYLVIGEEDLKCSMALRAVSGGELQEIPFGQVGQKYTEAGGKVDIILDDTNEIDFMIRNALKKDTFCAIMTLEALPVRKNKTNRVSVEVRFPSRNEAVVTVRDTGFGNIRKTDYRIWEQVINL